MSSTVLEYETELTPAELLRDFREGIEDEGLRAEASKLGLAAPGLADAESLDIKRTTQGSGGTQEIAVIFAGVGAKILYDFWVHILLPKLKARYGEGKLTSKKD